MPEGQKSGTLASVKQEMITQGGQRFHRKAEKDGFF
jgi:hypothetical protein